MNVPLNTRKLTRRLEKGASFWRRRRRRSHKRLKIAKRFQNEKAIEEALRRIRTAEAEIHSRDSLVFLIEKRLPGSQVIGEVAEN